MAYISHGTFKYTRRTKQGDPAEYNAPFKEATVELTVTSEDGEPPQLTIALGDLARETAVNQVHKMLRPAAPTEPNAPSHDGPALRAALAKAEAILERSAETITADVHAVEALNAAVVTVPAEEPTKRHRRTKAEMEAARAAEANPPDEQNRPQDAAPPDAAAATVTEYTQAEVLNEIGKKNSERLARPEDPEATDEENAAKRSPQVIRDLVAKFVPAQGLSYSGPPMTSRDIAPENRGRFLAALAAL